MKQLFCIAIVIFMSIQILQASKTDKKDCLKIKLEDCNIQFKDEPGKNISIQDALDICLNFVKENKINFNINVSEVNLWIKHSSKGMILTFYFFYNHRCLTIIIDENKKVVFNDITVSHER